VAVLREKIGLKEMALTLQYSDPDIQYPDAMWAKFLHTSVYFEQDRKILYTGS